jgi:hypothetical protein
MPTVVKFPSRVVAAAKCRGREIDRHPAPLGFLEIHSRNQTKKRVRQLLEGLDTHNPGVTAEAWHFIEFVVRQQTTRMVKMDGATRPAPLKQRRSNG